MTLNCIVDDSALLASIKPDAHDSIKQWLAQDAINVFVPLYALERLNQLRRVIGAPSGDARNALVWLDEITSITENKTRGRVQLQGPDDQYSSWYEVEKYLLPETPLSFNEGVDQVDSLSELLDHQFSFSGQSHPGLSPMGTGIGSQLDGFGSRTNGHGSARYNGDVSSQVSARLKPLLNFVVWRSHHTNAPTGAPVKYILVTNDPVIQRQASKFGVRAKMLNQLANIVNREAPRNDKTPEPVADQKVVHGRALSADAAEIVNGADEEEEHVVFEPVLRPGSSRGPLPDSPVIDPDDFARPASKSGPRGSKKNTRGQGRPPRDKNRGRVSQNNNTNNNTNTTNIPHGSPRGRGSQPARGNISASHPPPGPNQSPGVASGRAGHRDIRGNGSGRARGNANGSRGSRGAAVQHPIDPDSYARPSPPRGRGRGMAHRLWDPTSSG